MASLLAAALLLAAAGGAHAGLPHRPPLRPYPARGAANGLDRSLVARCAEKYRDVHVDHFSWAAPPEGRDMFKQRYFVCDEHWRPYGKFPGPIFFYVGNEADVTLYLNNTGLMWESAEEFGALLVFAEHRYYGKSKPYAANLTQHMQFLTSEQAMADYAELLTELKAELRAEASPVIGFGGSYGGMLGTWFRLKYPHILDGMVAGSAPIWDFLGEVPPVDPGFFAKIVTRDASPAAGASHRCAPNMRAAWRVLFDWGSSADGRARVREQVRLCPQANLSSGGDVEALAEWLQSAFDYLAMGNYPYESGYILNGVGTLPAFPMRAACSQLASEEPRDAELLQGLAAAAGVFYNYSGQLPCFNYSQGANEETAEDASFWGYQWCTEQFMPMERDGVHDMFWRQPFEAKAAVRQCQEAWGVTPRPLWATVQWGGRKLDALSNVVFSNGNYDPWSGGGVLRSLSDSVVAVSVDGGAHHLDLMFSNPEDPPSVREARAIELANVRTWVKEVYAREAARPSAT